MTSSYKIRRTVMAFIIFVVILSAIYTSFVNQKQPSPSAPKNNQSTTANVNSSPAIDGLAKLSIKGRAPKTDYSRAQFGDGWLSTGGCDTRNIILNRDLTQVQVDDSCNVISGVLNDPYTGKTIQFSRGASTSSAIQIDHVVALSDAWQTGAQLLPKTERVKLANDPLELLAVDGPANLQKLDSDAASWLPSNKPFRCQYVARQIAVKLKYNLWLTTAEHDAIQKVLLDCPDQTLPIK
jgi:hypothetical protein